MASAEVTRFIVLPAVVLSLLVITVVVILYTATGGKIQPNYGIVIDAGSSKTGITLYSWPGDKQKATGVVQQVWATKDKQTMAKFENITKFGEFLLPFIRDASKEIMSGRVEHTRLYLAATAGMRALNLTDPERAAILLNTTEETLKEKTKMVIEEVAILPETSEALHAWIAVNYVMDRLEDKENGETFGMLDMGGASAQIAYIGASNKAIGVKLYGIDYKVNVASNLCYGAEEAGFRFLAMLIQDQKSSVINNPCRPKGSPKLAYKGAELKKRGCLEGNINNDIDESTVYEINGGSDYNKCYKMASKLLDLKNCQKNFKLCFTENEPIPEKQSFIAMSSYYFNSMILNLTDDSISRNDLSEQTKLICGLNYNQTVDQPKADKRFAEEYCFRLNYIYWTLANVYRFEGSWTNINYRNSDDKGQEFGWSLGLMINATNAIPAELPTQRLIHKTPFIVLVVVFSLVLIAGIAYLLKNKSL